MDFERIGQLYASLAKARGTLARARREYEEAKVRSQDLQGQLDVLIGDRPPMSVECIPVPSPNPEVKAKKWA